MSATEPSVYRLEWERFPLTWRYKTRRACIYSVVLQRMEGYCKHEMVDEGGVGKSGWRVTFLYYLFFRLLY